jgi:acetyl-CoA synthetase
MENNKVINPSQEVIDNANVKEYEETYKRSIEEPEKFWGEVAERLEWHEKWHKVLDDSNPPFYKWFVGAKTNIIHNAIDRHLKTANRNKLAFIWEGEPGDQKTYSYHALNREVSKMANIIKSMGISNGDIVTIYMPQIPELVFAMLACAKLGAAHSVVYAGFSAKALADRIVDAKSNLVITSDGGWRRGKIIDLKGIVNEALEDLSIVDNCITVKRTGHQVYMEEGRDFWYHDLENEEFAHYKCDTVIIDSEDILFILYTSGTTGPPKGVKHTHGGYQVYTSYTHYNVFDIKPEDRYWCLADPGWITGHSFIVYAPLINGSTTMLYEGAPTYPRPDRVWEMIEKFEVNILYTSPTAIRGFMRFGDAWVKQHDLSSLRLLGSVGEPINPEAWNWYFKNIGGSRIPIMDTFWQTEGAGFMISPLPITPLKPGSATKPMFGIDADIVDENGQSVPQNEEGILVIKKPWPGLARTIYGDDERFKETYFGHFKEKMWYKAGDSARKDQDGYFWIIARIDDVLKVSGYRLGTAEVESALVSHKDVAEAAVIGLPHDIKGNAIQAYVILMDGLKGSIELEKEIKNHVRKEMGPIAVPEKIIFVDTVPKTRSGKIMRRVLKAQALGQDPGDLSTIEE